MAIFIPHIKGCDDANIIYTWIEWPNHGGITPLIKYNTTNNLTGAQPLGNIITSGAENQEINKAISIPNIQKIKKLDFFSAGSISLNSDNTAWKFLGEADKNLEINSQAELNLYGAIKTYLQAGSDNNTSITLASTTVDTTTTSIITHKAKEHNFKTGYVTIGNGGNATKEDYSLYIQNSCNALYFNATSDIRAKTKVQHASFKALNIVKSLPVYTFNYKETGSPSIGLIAQDAAKISFGSDFSLVNNETASGENGDYMTIKESKLIYILWKAIQEQQEQINYLTSLVKDLSKKIKK